MRARSVRRGEVLVVAAAGVVAFAAGLVWALGPWALVAVGVLLLLAALVGVDVEER